MSTAWFSKALLPWYREHQRPLPWRETRDPYRIWLSEVILQQTRVDQGMAYWHRFVQRYPEVRDLAQAPEDEVLRLWQGLGYYSRARNLRAAAQQVVAAHGGRFPASFQALRSLRGVGEYTAAAIGSIAFGLPEAVVDGNVYRVLSRVFGILTPVDSTAGRAEFRELALNLLNKDEPGDHNQAVMELGALVCTPRGPRCGACPLSARCIAHGTGRTATFPVKAGRTRTRERFFNYLHIRNKGSIRLQKRTGKDIWQGLYELPLIETPRSCGSRSFMRLLEEQFGKGWTILRHHGPVKHILSHQVIHARFWEVAPAKGKRLPAEWIAVKPGEMDVHAVPRLIERYLLRHRT